MLDRCAKCGQTILFGGVRDGGLKYCSQKCQTEGVLQNAIPEELVWERTASIHAGDCPQCGGPGPVDVHTSHRVWSALVLTSWSDRPHLVCRSCGVKAQASDAAISLVAGWWGFPWGFLYTPIQLVKNFRGMLRPPDPTQPSQKLESQVRLLLAYELQAVESQHVQVESQPEQDE